MGLTIKNKIIQRIQIIDDEPSARETMSDYVDDAKLTPINAVGPFKSIDFFLTKTIEESDAAICDHRLMIKGQYANFDGAEAVAKLYDNDFPAILCTNYSSGDIDIIRQFRSRIPVLIRTDDLDPSILLSAFKLCVEEISGIFSTRRKAWRTLIRIEDVDEQAKMIYLVLPGWDSSERIRVPIAMFPTESQKFLMSGFRFHAEVNLGADNPDEIFLKKFEFDFSKKIK